MEQLEEELEQLRKTEPEETSAVTDGASDGKERDLVLLNVRGFLLPWLQSGWSYLSLTSAGAARALQGRVQRTGGEADRSTH